MNVLCVHALLTLGIYALHIPGRMTHDSHLFQIMVTDSKRAEMSRNIFSKKYPTTISCNLDRQHGCIKFQQASYDSAEVEITNVDKRQHLHNTAVSVCTQRSSTCRLQVSEGACFDSAPHYIYFRLCAKAYKKRECCCAQYGSLPVSRSSPAKITTRLR